MIIDPSTGTQDAVCVAPRRARLPYARTLYIPLVCSCLFLWVTSTYRSDVSVVSGASTSAVEGPSVKVGQTV
ncbi:hypothetical protein EXIGLDRAFT_735481 [Exidia glandulosa HHB12029]|uniref:Uncharacterized protein n=1 Tax=Exidia glandulosa HHB12029 TaxID=1314781 RepID=A0A165JTS5_EXIGL|nr:hypothetical protein EXIGLDRAFT_735481 [Exidia glandulosa HHB12029]